MPIFRKQISLRWSDLDPNFHVRHSVYYDLGAQIRVEILHELGLTPEVMRNEHFGPVLLREECVFRREIRLAQPVTITATLATVTPDGSRWTIRHELLTDADKVLATITVDGAWIDTDTRKFAAPTPAIAMQVLNSIPRTSDFKS